MDYTKSVYIPEVALDKASDLQMSKTKQDLTRRVAGLHEVDQGESIIV